MKETERLWRILAGGELCEWEHFPWLKTNKQTKKTSYAVGWKRSVFILILRKGNAKEGLNYHTIVLLSHASKIMLKILQVKL